MLKLFAVKNFLSFGEQVSFTMEPGKVRGKREHLSECRGCNLLRFSSIYGSNAAGKSNYIYAMRFAKNTILHGMPKNTIQRYHRVNPENRDKPTEFVFEIRLGKKKYRYCFSLNMYNAEFLSESLIDFSTPKEKEIFSRDLISGEQQVAQLSKIASANSRIQTYLEDMELGTNILFLAEMNRNKAKAYELIPELQVFADVYNWFDKKLHIVFPEEHLHMFRPKLFEESGSESICSMLQKFALNITDTTVEPVAFETIFASIPGNPPSKLYEELKNDMYETLQDAKKADIDNNKIEYTLQLGTDLYSVKLDENDELVLNRLQLVHGENGNFNISEESDGTRRLIELMDILLSEEDDATYVVDEIDRSLHPLITKRFIELFLNETEGAQRQLIVSTHESRLLDLSMLRKDEIWFMTKENGMSKLERLEAYDVRPDLKIDMAYLKGKIVKIPHW